jgi:hypothetical protein
MSNVLKDESGNIAAAMCDVISGVPFVGIGISLAKIYTSFNEKIFLDKLEAFLKASQTSPEERKCFEISLNLDKEEFYKKLWILIDRLDDNEKATIVGKIFKRAIEGKIKIDQFLEASDIVRKTYIGYLKSMLIEYQSGTNPIRSNQYHRRQLIQIGLLVEKDGVRKPNQMLMAELTPIGKIIYPHIIL